MATPALLCFCNPLLDISAEVKPELLTKYELKPANAILAEAQHVPLYGELVADYPVEYIAGGAGLNTARATQWMLQDQKLVHFTGCVGKDAYADKLRESATAAGVAVHFQVDEATPTGTCAVLIAHNDRSLVANLAAANKFNRSHLATDEMRAVIEQSGFFYISGFTLTVAPDAVLELGKHAAEHNKAVLWNISAPFIAEFFTEHALATLAYVDVVFANETECAAFGTKQGWGTDAKEVAAKMAALPKANAKRSRVVIFTHGKDPVVTFHDGIVEEFPVEPLPAGAVIVDTNGAGDSFCGGFLSQYVLGKPLATCIAAGNYCAGEVIQQSGCKFPPKPTKTF